MDDEQIREFARRIMEVDEAAGTIEQWLQRLVNIEEAEAVYTTSDPSGRVPPVPFGFLNEEWRALLKQVQPGDELWEYRSPPETWDNLMGAAGVALVRDKKVIAEVMTAMN